MKNVSSFGKGSGECLRSLPFAREGDVGVIPCTRHAVLNRCLQDR